MGRRRPAQAQDLKWLYAAAIQEEFEEGDD